MDEPSIAGHPSASPLVKLIKGELAPQMPVGSELAPRKSPASKADSLSDSFNRYSPFRGMALAYQKPVKARSTQAEQPRMARNPIDNFVPGQVWSHGRREAPLQRRPTAFSARFYLDLVGMQPSPEEMQAFLSMKPPPRMRSHRQAVRRSALWGTVGPALARSGSLRRGPAASKAMPPSETVWRYRDWVIDALNSNMRTTNRHPANWPAADEHSKTRNIISRISRT